MLVAAALTGSSVCALADDNAREALTKCLDNRAAQSPNGEVVDMPPGLSRHSLAKVVRLAGGKLYAYEGTSPHELACGIAIYGAVSDATKAGLIHIVESHGARWASMTPVSYSLPGALPGKTRYWGDVRAPGMEGVLIMERSPSANAPSLEIDFHAILMR